MWSTADGHISLIRAYRFVQVGKSYFPVIRPPEEIEPFHGLYLTRQLLLANSQPDRYMCNTVCPVQSVSSTLFSSPSSRRYRTRAQTSVWLRAKKPSNIIVRGCDKSRYKFHREFPEIRGFRRYSLSMAGWFLQCWREDSEDSFCERFVFAAYEYFMRIFRVEIRTRVSRLRGRSLADEIVDPRMYLWERIFQRKSFFFFNRSWRKKST